LKQGELDGWVILFPNASTTFFTAFPGKKLIFA
jgi:hypothetical protein